MTSNHTIDLERCLWDMEYRQKVKSLLNQAERGSADDAFSLHHGGERQAA